MQLVLFNPLIGPYQVLPLWPRVDLGAMVMKGTPHSPNLQHYCNLTIRLFSVIYRTLGGGGQTVLFQIIQFNIRPSLGVSYPSAEKQSSQFILQPQLTGQYIELNVKTVLFQIIQFSISTQIRRENSSISSNSV